MDVHELQPRPIGVPVHPAMMPPERRAEILSMAILRGHGFYTLRAAEVAALCTALEASKQETARLREAMGVASDELMVASIHSNPQLSFDAINRATAILKSGEPPPFDETPHGLQIRWLADEAHSTRTALESSERRAADLMAAIAQAVETTQEIRMSGYPRSWVAVDSEAWSALLSATAPPAEQPATGDAVDTWEGPRLPKDRISYGVGKIIWSGPRPDLVIEDEAEQPATEDGDA